MINLENEKFLRIHENKITKIVFQKNIPFLQSAIDEFKDLNNINYEKLIISQDALENIDKVLEYLEKRDIDSNKYLESQNFIRKYSKN